MLKLNGVLNVQRCKINRSFLLIISKMESIFEISFWTFLWPKKCPFFKSPDILLKMNEL